MHQPQGLPQLKFIGASTQPHSLPDFLLPYRILIEDQAPVFFLVFNVFINLACIDLSDLSPIEPLCVHVSPSVSQLLQ